MSTEVKETKEIKEEVEEAKKTSSTLNDATVIKVRSLVPNVFYTCPQTHEYFSWYEVGEIQDMTYKQLKIMKSQHPRFFTDQWLLVSNKDAVKKLNLKAAKENVNIKDMIVFNGNDFEEAETLIKSYSDDALAMLKPKVIKNIKTGKIANVKIIRLLEQYLEVNLMQYV